MKIAIAMSLGQEDADEEEDEEDLVQKALAMSLETWKQETEEEDEEDLVDLDLD